MRCNPSLKRLLPLVSPIFVSLPISLLILIAGCSAATAKPAENSAQKAEPKQASTAQKSEPSWVIAVVKAITAENRTDWPQVEVEKILGKPVKADKEDGSAEYKRKGFRAIGVANYWAIEIDFEKDPGDWKAALKFCGISDEGVKATVTKTTTSIVGIKGLQEGWKATYFPAFYDRGQLQEGQSPTEFSRLSFFYDTSS